MLTWINRNKHSVLFSLFLLIPAIFFLCTHKPNVGFNAPTYAQFSIIRQPMYAIFIWFFRWAGKYQYHLVMWAQSLLTLLSLLYARYWLKKNWQLSDFLIAIIFIITLVTISFYYQMQNMDDPEGITFPIFIFTFFITVDCFQKIDLKKIITLSLLVSALILTRTQFYFYYIVFAVLLIIYFLKKISFKNWLAVFFIFLSSAFVTNILDRTYHYIMNGHFITEPFSGVLLIIQPLYLADRDSEKYFSDPVLHQKTREMLHEIYKDKLNKITPTLSSFHFQYYGYANNEYAKNYVLIQSIVNSVLTKKSFEDIYKVDNNDLIKMNRDTLYISKILFLHNMKKNVFLYFYRVISLLGGIPYFLFFTILFFIACKCVLKNRGDFFSSETSFAFCFFLILFLNAILVAIAEPYCTRYFCYTQFLLYCFAAYIGKQIFYLSE